MPVPTEPTPAATVCRYQYWFYYPGSATAEGGGVIGPAIRDPSQDNRDAYGRLLRCVERKGRDVGRKQIHKGWAKLYVFESPFKRVTSHRRAKRRARSDDRGVWDRCGGDFHLPL